MKSCLDDRSNPLDSLHPSFPFDSDFWKYEMLISKDTVEVEEEYRTVAFTSLVYCDFKYNIEKIVVTYYGLSTFMFLEK